MALQTDRKTNALPSAMQNLNYKRRMMNTWLDTSSAENDVEVTPQHEPGMNQQHQGTINRNIASETSKVTHLFY